jgi:hypothetical protein
VDDWDVMMLRYKKKSLSLIFLPIVHHKKKEGEDWIFLLLLKERGRSPLLPSSIAPYQNSSLFSDFFGLFYLIPSISHVILSPPSCIIPIIQYL